MKFVWLYYKQNPYSSVKCYASEVTVGQESGDRELIGNSFLIKIGSDFFAKSCILFFSSKIEVLRKSRNIHI